MVAHSTTASLGARKKGDRGNPLLFLAILVVGGAFLYATFQAGDAVTKFNAGARHEKREQQQQQRQQQAASGFQEVGSPQRPSAEAVGGSGASPAANPLSGVDEATARAFAVMDADGDGAVAHREFWVADHSDITADPVEVWSAGDTDLDGQLSPLELQAALREFGAGGAGGGGQPPPQNLFAELDTDGDGRLTRREFVQLSGGALDDNTQRLWNTDDRDGDGAITFAEFSGPKGEGQPGQSGQHGGGGSDEALALFDMMDSSSDGRCTRAEFMNAQSGNGAANDLWVDADADRSGWLSAEEFVEHFLRVQSSLSSSSGGERPGANGDNDVQPPVDRWSRLRAESRAPVTGGFGTSGDDNHPDVQAAQGAFDLFDDDEDRRVSRTEFFAALDAPQGDSKATSLWAAADRDGSGDLTLDEFGTYYAGVAGRARMQEQERQRPQAPDSGGGATDNIVALFNTIDSDGDGVISRQNFAAYHSRSGNELPTSAQDQLFENADVDGSGDVEFEELRRQVEDIEAKNDCGEDAFCFLDRDASGFLEEPELSLRVFRGGAVPTEFWASEDRDGDGRVSRAEFEQSTTTAAGHGGRAEGAGGREGQRESDGTTSRGAARSGGSGGGASWGRSQQEASGSRGGGGGKPVPAVKGFGAYDKDRDGVISAVEFWDVEQDDDDAFTQWQALDRNGDGQVSRKEFVGVDY